MENWQVSIHTSTWEVTSVISLGAYNDGFNPHLHVGGDQL